MTTSTTSGTPARKHRTSTRVKAAPDARSEMAEVMTKLHAIETELGALLNRSLCDTLKASGALVKDVDDTVRTLLGSAFQATRALSQGLLDAGQRTVETGRDNAHDAAAVVQDFGQLAKEATRQVMAGAAEGLAEIRASGHKPSGG